MVYLEWLQKRSIILTTWARFINHLPPLTVKIKDKGPIIQCPLGCAMHSTSMGCRGGNLNAYLSYTLNSDSQNIEQPAAYLSQLTPVTSPIPWSAVIISCHVLDGNLNVWDVAKIGDHALFGRHFSVTSFFWAWKSRAGFESLVVQELTGVKNTSATIVNPRRAINQGG